MILCIAWIQNKAYLSLNKHNCQRKWMTTLFSLWCLLYKQI